MKVNLKEKNNDGFSLLELVIVIAVLSILSILGGPYFLRLINLARFESAKNYMRDSFTSCINDPNISPSNAYIPGVVFQSSNCSSLMTATIDNSCTISMDMSNGAKTGWNNSYEECSNKVSNTASNNDSGSNNSNKDTDLVAVADSSNSAARVWNEANWDDKQGCIGGGDEGLYGGKKTKFGMDKKLHDMSNSDLRHEMERQALDCHYEAHLMANKQTHNDFPDRNLAIHLDPTEEKNTGKKICRNDLLQRINCPGTNEFDEQKLKPLSEKHRLEHEQLAAEFLKETEENIEKQLPEIAKARAERREQLRERGLLIEKEDIGRTDKCRSYWGWTEPCSNSKEANEHEERMKTDSKYQSEQQNLQKQIELDTYGAFRGDQNTTDGYHRKQFRRVQESTYKIRNKYHWAVTDLYKKHQEELDQIRN